MNILVLVMLLATSSAGPFFSLINPQSHPREKLDCPAVSALGVRSRKLNNFGRSSDGLSKNGLSRDPPCFGRHVKLLIPAVFALVSTHQFTVLAVCACC
jgi:hypothetical protein